MNRSLVCAAIATFLFAACDSADDEPPAAPVVVYVGPAQEARLADAFSAFTAETGVPIKLMVAEGDVNVRNVIENRGTPPADVLVTSTIIDIWRAADEGALRPLTATHFEKVPAVLRDPDRTWAAIGVHYAMIVTAADAGAPDDYSDFATSELRGQVCLSSSALPVNRALIAMLIEDVGIKPAERMVRAWVRNLAASPYATEQKLVDALRSGTCRYGIVSGSADIEGLATIAPNPLYLDIDAIGIARHTGQPESAQALVQWMLESIPLPEPESSNGRNLGLAGWRDEDVRLLVERAGYR